MLWVCNMSNTVNKSDRALELSYVALGDSVATGTLTYFNQTTGYPSYIVSSLRNNSSFDKKLRFMNLAQDGDTSSQLLWRIRNSNTHQNAIKNADFITVSIGGNNIMSAVNIPGFNTFKPLVAKRGVEQFKSTWGEIAKVIRQLNPRCKVYVMTLYNPYNKTPFLPSRYFSDKGLNEIAEGYISEINNTILSYREYNTIVDKHTVFDL